MKKLLSVLLILAMVFSFAACGDTTEDPNAGVYDAVTATAMGFTFPIEEVYPAGASVELKSGGKGVVTLGEDSFNVKWSLEGESLTITVSGEPSVGTLKDGTISMDFMNMGLLMVFQREGAAPVEIPVEENLEKLVDAAVEELLEESAVMAEVGMWELLRIDSEVEADVVTEEDVKILVDNGIVVTLELKEDGSGIFNLGGEPMELTWGEGKITMEGEAVDYLINGDELSMLMPDGQFVMKRAE